MHLLNVAVLLTAAATTTASSSCRHPVAKPTPPAKAHCDVPGTISKPKILDQYSHSDVQSCSRLCYNNTKCVTFSGNTKNNACTLYSATLKAMGFKAIDEPTAKDPLVFWSRNCFACPSSTTTSTSSTTSSTSKMSSSTSTSSTTPPCVPLSGNLLQNGDFEASKTNYAPWNYDATGDISQPSPRIVSPGEGGTGNAFSAAVVYYARPPNDSFTVLGQSIANGICPNSSYAVSFDYMFNSTTPSSGIRVFACDQQVVLITNNFERGNIWLSSNTTINCQDNYTVLTMYLQVGQGTGEEMFHLDNISFELVN